MSYILATTDFSAVSENSLQYAAALARHMGMPLTLLHSFIMPAMFSDVTIPASLIDDTRTDAVAKMAAISKQLVAQHPKLATEEEVLYGTFTECIEQITADKGLPFMVVMGNSNTKEDASWLLSTLRTAHKNIQAPTLAVPAESKWNGVNRICFAADVEQPERTTVLNAVATLATQLNTKLHVLNVQEDASLHDESYDFGEQTKTILRAVGGQFHYRHNSDIDSGIREFCAVENIDWLILTPGKYPFLEKIFHQSHTKAMASTAEIPLLILH
jgi:nucleotide-binding universal stress UspA family protein